MADNPHHEHILKELTDQLEPVLSKSSQAIYLYLDDEHKICNQKFVDLVGYDSIQEWVENEAPLSDVVEEDQEKVVNAYMDASQNFNASTLDVSLTKKDGGTVEVSVIMAPISFNGEVFVIHFITER